MGKSSGGVRGGLQPGDSSFTGSIRNPEDLVKIKNPAVYREMKSAIARYHSVMGVREQSVKIADLPPNTYGVQTTDVRTGRSTGVFINKKVHNQSKATIEKYIRRGYDNGWTTRTNKPIAHAITHELAHASWNSAMKGVKYKAAQKEIQKLSARWLADKNKKGYGKYAHSNLDEFWAEVVTKAVHGTQDRYTAAVKRIAKKYQL